MPTTARTRRVEDPFRVLLAAAAQTTTTTTTTTTIITMPIAIGVSTPPAIVFIVVTVTILESLTAKIALVEMAVAAPPEEARPVITHVFLHGRMTT